MMYDPIGWMIGCFIGVLSLALLALIGFGAWAGYLSVACYQSKDPASMACYMSKTSDSRAKIDADIRLAPGQ